MFRKYIIPLVALAGVAFGEAYCVKNPLCVNEVELLL